MSAAAPVADFTVVRDHADMRASAIQLLPAQPISVIDRLFEKLYRRTARRYIELVIAAGGGYVFAMTAINLTVTVPFFDATRRQWDRTEAIGAEAMLVAFPLFTALGFVLMKPLLVWQRGARSEEAVVAAWRTAVVTVPRYVALSALIIVIFSVPAAWRVAPIFHLSGFEALLIGVFIVFMIIGEAALVYLVIERAMRPCIRDIAQLLTTNVVAESRGAPTLSLKLLVLLPAINVYGAMLVLGMTSFPGLRTAQRLETAVGGSIALSLTLPLALALALRRSVLTRLHDLTSAFGRVRDGDLTTRVLPLAGDEFDAAGAAFNEMVAGLAQRDALQEQNAQLLEEVRSSRARIVAVGDTERRRIERNLHDGAQQQLVGLAIKLSLLSETLTDEAARAAVIAIQERLRGALNDLRELARGLHPSVLTTDGIAGALDQLAARAPLPVTVTAVEERFPQTVESTAYFVASEALANIAKHADAHEARVSVVRSSGQLAVIVTDDGVGGATIDGGTGLVGLVDRVEAIGGRVTVHSPPGHGTTLTAILPLA